MTEAAFEILDQLYFVASYEEIANSVQVPDNELCGNLKQLLSMGYIHCYFPDRDTEIPYDEAEFGKHCREYFYLATKAGLIYHNSR